MLFVFNDALDVLLANPVEQRIKVRIERPRCRTDLLHYRGRCRLFCRLELGLLAHKNERSILTLRFEVHDFHGDLFVSRRIDTGVANRFLVNVTLLCPGQRLAPTSLPLII